jgi:glycosyltransferase involved in cell wall biosynthesis
MTTFDGKVGLVQRVLPSYRTPFFDVLAQACTGGLEVFAGQPRPGEHIQPINHLKNATLVHAHNWHLFQGAGYLCIQVGLMQWLKGWQPDVLIVEANPRYLRTPAAVRWMHRRQKPVIGWGLGAPPLSGPLSKIRRKRRQNFIMQFDVLITYSQTGAAEYARLGFPQDRIIVAANAVSPAPQHPFPNRALPKAEEKTRVLFVGRLQKRKNLENLICACGSLPPALQPELVIVGDGPDRQRLEALAERQYPTTRFTGALYDQDLVDQFLQADLFVLPGTGGLAIQQAMSYGLPVIAAEADGTQADLVREQNGWQVPPDDTAALTHALQTALSNLPGLQEMGKESFRIVTEEINLEQMVESFVTALHRSVV